MLDALLSCMRANSTFTADATFVSLTRDSPDLYALQVNAFRFFDVCSTVVSACLSLSKTSFILVLRSSLSAFAENFLIAAFITFLGAPAGLFITLLGAPAGLFLTPASTLAAGRFTAINPNLASISSRLSVWPDVGAGNPQRLVD
jgi:hypothetical protein